MSLTLNTTPSAYQCLWLTGLVSASCLQMSGLQTRQVKRITLSVQDNINI